ncbi:hypothetical protein IWQ47_005126 [Aquimarina sp. EL_43]|uniref:PQQ-binding-like beta-propeller repeat protein n=1 Tax=unclassified Aquimarina TaxID=2627091 RepID=UPI0018CADD63|nr:MULTISPECIES: PQQ-binding-like beta-propeller repeat protein [unclassified Aquimarina]MBG6133654.1 hypothetical protein [Aquimarina sp. EL_35]MBG6152423.1 hypothetical protein [Aquimarina sp. EL_32]MBG6172027.1 hypothetical protein [Aquimarina sp. EL_43]
MKLANRLENIFSFDFFNNELVFQQESKLILQPEGSIIEEGISSFLVKNNNLITNNTEQIKLYFSDKSINLKGTFRLANGFLVDEFYFNIGKVNKERKTYVINLESGEINDFPSKPYYPHQILKKDRAFIFSQKIEFYNPFSGEVFWNKDISELLKTTNTEIYGKPQIINNKLFFFLFDSSHQTDERIALGLDIETREILWESENFGGWLITFEDKIYAIKDKQVQILNPETFEVTNLDLREELSVLDKQLYKPEDKMTWQVPFSFSNSTYVIKNNHLYFTQEKNNTIGIIDLQTKKLLWHTDIEINSGDTIPIITDIKVYDTRLYILDSGNTLHIFEKDEII